MPTKFLKICKHFIQFEIREKRNLDTAVNNISSYYKLHAWDACVPRTQQYNAILVHAYCYCTPHSSPRHTTKAHCATLSVTIVSSTYITVIIIRMITFSSKIKIFKTIVRSIMTYGSEVWTTNKHTRTKLMTACLLYTSRCV